MGERTVSRLVEICGDAMPLFGEDASGSRAALVSRRPRCARSQLSPLG